MTLQLFKEGDLVCQVSGGPEMLVVATTSDCLVGDEVTAGAVCVWEADHRLFERLFPQDALAPVRYNRRKKDRDTFDKIPGSPDCEPWTPLHFPRQSAS
jgi:uncharacterized protein YodC (DUF2158 family)